MEEMILDGGRKVGKSWEVRFGRPSFWVGMLAPRRVVGVEADG